MKREQKQVVDLEAFEVIREERDDLQGQLHAAWRANDSLMGEIKQLKAQAQERINDLEQNLDASQRLNSAMNARNEELLAERDAARMEADRMRKRRQEAEKRAASLAADTDRAREEVARLVELNNKFMGRVNDIEREKNQIVEVSNGFARERDKLQADYDARGKVIKKLRKRLSKLKKKLKH